MQITEFFNAAADRAMREKTGWPYKRTYAQRACKILNNIIDSRKSLLRRNPEDAVHDLNDIGLELIERKLTNLYEAMSGRPAVCEQNREYDTAMEYREICSNIYAALVNVHAQRQWEDELKQCRRLRPAGKIPPYPKTAP